MENGPRVLVNASAIGYYGDTGETWWMKAQPGEMAFSRKFARTGKRKRNGEAFGVRVVCVRFGLVLGPGGMVKVIRPLFALGLAARWVMGGSG